MKAFKHIDVGSIKEASRLLETGEGNVRVIAGGTDILGTMKEKIHDKYPDILINLKTIEGLRYVYNDDEYLKIGTLTTLEMLAESRVIKENFTALAESAKSVASPQIRNVGTIGGNICQEPRCWYYRSYQDVFHCMRKGGAKCNALLGENHIHSIFGVAKVIESPCNIDCPNGNLIPEYLDKIKNKDIAGAAEILVNTNPLASITGRVCPHFCENSCNRNGYDEFVNIRDIERYIGDYILANGEKYFRTPSSMTGKKVAIIGSGPAGLSAAFFLRNYGHDVTIFDSKEKAGGMLTYGIPEYRLPKIIIEKTVELISNMGVEFRLGRKISTTDVAEIIKYDSVFVAIGAWDVAKMEITNDKYTEDGINFLQNIISEKCNLDGKSVAVIGGGNVAMDCVRSSLRAGAKEAHLIYRRTKNEMPATIDEIENGEKEGVIYHYLVNPVEIYCEKNKLKGMRLVNMELGDLDNTGRRSSRPIVGSEFNMSFDLVVMAIGQKMEKDLSEALGISQNKSGFIKTTEQSFATNIKNIYAGGDATNKGPATVVEALSAGRKAAYEISENLGIVPSINVSSNQPILFNVCEGCTDRKNSTPTNTLSYISRNLFEEDCFGYNDSTVKIEAERCLNCGCVAAFPSDIGTAILALDAVIKTNKRYINASDFWAVRKLSSTVLDKGELVVEIIIPQNMSTYRSRYLKFRVRNSIDFPLVGVAVSAKMKDNIVDDIRIVLGAVAPIPIRSFEAEEYLKTKELNQKTASKAAIIALKNVSVLNKNNYKVSITKSLIKRALISLYEELDEKLQS